MHRRAIPSAYLALRLHVFDLYSGMCQFRVYLATLSNGGIRKGSPLEIIE
jgi:hypothetical protein